MDHQLADLAAGPRLPGRLTLVDAADPNMHDRKQSGRLWNITVRAGDLTLTGVLRRNEREGMNQ